MQYRTCDGLSFKVLLEASIVCERVVDDKFDGIETRELIEKLRLGVRREKFRCLKSTGGKVASCQTERITVSADATEILKCPCVE